MRLGLVADYIGGVTFTPDDKLSLDKDDAVVCLRTKNIQSLLDESDLIAVPAHLIKRDEQFLRVGDILISSANSWNLVAKCCWVPELSYRAAPGGFIAALRARAEVVDSRYLYYWLSSERTQAAARACARQTTNIANLSKEQFLNLDIPLATFEAQRRITSILDKADTIRRKRQEAIALTEQLLRSTFLEMFGDPVTNPKHWPKKSLREISVVSGGLQVTEKRKSLPVEVPYLRVANVLRDRLDLNELKSLRVTTAEFERAQVQKGDLLVVEGHGNPDEIGRSAVWDGSVSPCVHQNHLIRVRADGTCVTSTYLNAFLNSAAGKLHMRRVGKTTSGLNTISTENVRSLETLLPPLELQKKFGAAVVCIHNILRTETQSLTQSEALFNSLVQRAFSGQL